MKLVLAISSVAIYVLLSVAIFAHAEMALVPQTGQTTSYVAGDDGALQEGVPWPNPRFTDNYNGTVTDNLTGLVWLKNANCFGYQSWDSAISSANNLASGACGLTDGSTTGQWRLPNRKELKSLINRRLPVGPATWLNGQYFTAVQSYYYHSSSSYANSATNVWVIDMQYGYVKADIKQNTKPVWPVRSGQ